MISRPILQSLLALLALGAASTATAAGPNDHCLKCHGDQAQAQTAGKAVAMDLARFKASAHGASRIKCAACHEDAPVDGDHAAKLKPVNCSNCHEDAVKDYAATVHGKARAGGNQIAATCVDCHGPTHDIQVSTEPASRTHRTNVEATCGSCHGNDKIVQQAHLPGGNVQATFHDSIHGELIHRSDSANSGRVPTCTGCHGAHNILSHNERESRVAHDRIPDTCGGCHQRAVTAYGKGKHGKLQQAGAPSAPVCADCHSAHSIQRTSKPEWVVAVIGECGNCHDDYVTSYHKTYHGKVTDLGFANIATCASCHGSHDIRPASDPLSTVSPQNRLQTCRQCHKGASASFASWDPHPRPTDRDRSGVLYFANIGMNVLLWGVFLFFGLHTVLWAYRSFADVLKRRRGRDAER